MSKREQKWSQKYNYVLVHPYSLYEVRIKCGHTGEGANPEEAAECQLLYRNPDARYEYAAPWVRNAPKHPDYFGYQEPPAEPELLAMGTEVVAKGALSLEFAAPAYGTVTHVDAGDKTYRVKFPYVVTVNGPCRNATFWCRADALEAME